MPPKTMRQQNVNQSATSMRKNNSQRAQTRAAMATEYQERFLPPRCHTAVVSSSTHKNLYHSHSGTSTTFRSFCVTHKHPPKAGQPPLPPKGPQNCCSAPNNPILLAAKQKASQVEDYTSVYKSDFKAWQANKRRPYKLTDSLKVSQGLNVTDSVAKSDRSLKNPGQVATDSKPVPQEEEPKPFERLTSYRLDYVPHPVQPRQRIKKPEHQTKGLLFEPPVSVKPNAQTKNPTDMNQEFLDGANKFFHEFKTWSLETKFHGRGKAKESSPLADHKDFLSTTHTDYGAYKCQCTKPDLPSMQTRENNKDPFQAMTTMKEDYKAWCTQQHLPSVCKEELDQPKKTTFSRCTTKPAEMYWTTLMDRGVTWADGGM